MLVIYRLCQTSDPSPLSKLAHATLPPLSVLFAPSLSLRLLFVFSLLFLPPLRTWHYKWHLLEHSSDGHSSLLHLRKEARCNCVDIARIVADSGSNGRSGIRGDLPSGFGSNYAQKRYPPRFLEPAVRRGTKSSGSSLKSIYRLSRDSIKRPSVFLLPIPPADEASFGFVPSSWRKRPVCKVTSVQRGYTR